MLHADTAAVSRHCGLRRSGVIMAARPPGPRPHEEETMPQPNGNHARLVDSVIRGTSRDACAPEYVKRSWLRCVDEYGLDPESNALPAVVSSQELTLRKERSLELVSFADAEMAHLYGQLAGSGHSIILTDGDGVLLSYYSDPSFKGAAARAGLVPGAVWSERYGGTNGMGTCLLERGPLIVHRNQHFLARNTGLTCCAAPIFDHRGELAAVLDASGESDRAQQHTLVLVNMSAQMIENRLFLNRFRDAFVVRFHSRPELVGTWGEGIIALDAAGAIAALDRNALFQLGSKGSSGLLGAPLERVFNISLAALLGRSQKKSFHALPIYETRHGGRFFAVAQAPHSKRQQAGKQQLTPEEERASRAGSGRPGDGTQHTGGQAPRIARHPAVARGRVRHRQGAFRARPALCQRAGRQAVRGDQLWSTARNAHAERVDRARRGRWHGRWRSRPHRTGQRRHAVSRRRR